MIVTSHSHGSLLVVTLKIHNQKNVLTHQLFTQILPIQCAKASKWDNHLQNEHHVGD